MQGPSRYARCLVQLLLEPGEGGYGIAAIYREDPIATGEPRQGSEKFDCEGRQRHLVDGWYAPDQGAGFIAATLGAIVVLFIWNRIAASRGR